MSAEQIKSELGKEETKFRKTLKDGLKFIKDNVDAYAKFNEAVLIKEYDKELPLREDLRFDV